MNLAEMVERATQLFQLEVQREIYLWKRVVLEIEGKRYISPLTYHKFRRSIGHLESTKKESFVLEMYSFGDRLPTVSFRKLERMKYGPGINGAVYTINGLVVEDGRLIVQVGDVLKRFGKEPNPLNRFREPKKTHPKTEPQTKEQPEIIPFKPMEGNE